MASSATPGLTALATVNGNELLYVVDDPSGTPLDRKVTVDQLKAYFAPIVHKAANESVTSSAALQDDDHLFFTCPAGTTRVGEVVLFVDSGAEAADIALAMTTSTGTILYGVNGLAPASTTESGDAVFYASTAGGATIGIDDTFKTMVILKFSVTAGGTDATVKLRWAQGTSNATATTVLAGSHLTHQAA